jgi:hypothetical protein
VLLSSATQQTKHHKLTKENIMAARAATKSTAKPDAAGRRTKTAGEPPLALFADKPVTAVTQSYVDWIKENVGVDVDPQSVQISASLRRQFQKSETNQQRIAEAAERNEAEAEARAQRAEEREQRKAEREAAKAAKAAEPKAEKPAPAAKAKAAPAVKAAPAKRAAAKPAAAKATTAKPAARRRPTTKPAATDGDF